MAAAQPSAKRACVVRPAKDMEEARGLWWPLMQELGWNRAEADIKTHYPVCTKHLGPSGWLHVYDEAKPDVPEGCITSFVFDNQTGWIGFFCMNEKSRGYGWGAALFRQSLIDFERVGTKYVGLDAIKAQVGTYRRRGLKETNIIRLVERKPLTTLPLKGGFEHVEVGDERLVPLDEIPGNILVENELAITGFERNKLWSKEAMFDRDDAWGLALVKEGNKEELEGWILVRKCPHGYRFGPLYAESRDTAKFLLHQAMYRLQDSEGGYYAEVWYSNSEAMSVFEESGWTFSNLDYYRMWLHGNVPEPQKPGGKADQEMFAIFDASEG